MLVLVYSRRIESLMQHAFNHHIDIRPGLMNAVILMDHSHNSWHDRFSLIEFNDGANRSSPVPLHGMCRSLYPLKLSIKAPRDWPTTPRVFSYYSALIFFFACFM